MVLSLVIFDCDGVLIDSEALCDRVVSEALTRQGWPLSPAECHQHFLGLTFSDIKQAAEARLSRPLPYDWVDEVIANVTHVMATEVRPIPGARDALEATVRLGLPYRIASNSSPAEMTAKFNLTGLAPLVEGRIHSAYDLIARGQKAKPAPDIFLEAAATENVPPEECVVVEDSLPGVQAAIAAGMTCLAYCPDDHGSHLSQAGARPFASMWALPDLLHRLLIEAK